jgi:hypothetical protein
MIHYTLVCEAGHTFESWFPSSKAFETQNSSGFITCPHCQSHYITKGIMAPAIKAGRTSEPTSPPLIGSEHEQAARQALKKIYEHVITHGEDVGDNFPEEARLMQAGLREESSIYGSATSEEAHALKKEGIDILTLPPFLFNKPH